MKNNNGGQHLYKHLPNSFTVILRVVATLPCFPEPRSANIGYSDPWRILLF